MEDYRNTFAYARSVSGRAVKRYIINMYRLIVDHLFDNELYHPFKSIWEFDCLLEALLIISFSDKEKSIECIISTLSKNMGKRISQTRASNQGVEVLDYLNVAYLLLEAYHAFIDKVNTLMVGCQYNEITELLPSWNIICGLYEEAIHALLLRGDLELANMWQAKVKSNEEMLIAVDKKRLTL